MVLVFVLLEVGCCVVPGAACFGAMVVVSEVPPFLGIPFPWSVVALAARLLRIGRLLVS